MKTCCFCDQVEPKEDLYFNEETEENAHLGCVRKYMSFKSKNKPLQRKADKFAWLLVSKEKSPPK